MNNGCGVYVKHAALCPIIAGLPHFHHCPTGLMGSEKNTLGKILSHVLGYSFYDSATLIEQEVDGISVAEIFKCNRESFFRKNED
ncbi:hypothetical protein V6N11_073370 [Hibiscus sabdariffa]|uniref:Uncharacterized protein n=1 Tax=Hibiscus sabdariffa TaxID=183260 RepID=A0ABR2P4B1_9ROSI